VTQDKRPLKDIYADDNTGSSKEIQDLEFGPGSIEAIKHTCEAIGQIMESWGFKKILGMTWAFLYLCPEPASAKDICKALNISPALVSITIQDLLRWQVVKKSSPVGKRRDYYEAEHDVWKMIRKVFMEREKNQMEMVHAKLETALASLNAEGKQRLDLKSKRTCQFQKLRLEDLKSITEVAQGLLDGFISDGNLCMFPIFSALKSYNQLAMAVNSTRS